MDFGSPVSMREYCRARGVDFKKIQGEERRPQIAALGKHLMDAVGRIVPVVPVALIATVFVARAERGISAIELKAVVEQLLERLEAAGAKIYIPRRDLDYAVSVGLRMLTLRRLVSELDGVYQAEAAELPVLRYYANSIAHFLPAA